MDNYSVQSVTPEQISAARVSFMNKTYAWMVAALLISGGVADYFYSAGHYLTLLENPSLKLLLILATFGLVIGINSAITKVSKAVIGLMFIAFSTIIGITFSSLFAIYTASSIANVFFISSGMFAAMSAFGYITKKDLTGMGNFMMMGLFGIIIVAVVNMFLANPALYWVQSFFGVIIFSGLTAWDTQKLKEMAVVELENGDLAGKLAISGALTLYLDFINLFLYLLRFLGIRRD